MIYYNYDEKQMLMIDTKVSKLYSFDTHIRLIDEVSLCVITIPESFHDVGYEEYA